MKLLEELKAAHAASVQGEWEESEEEGLIYGLIDIDGVNHSYLICDVVDDPTITINEQDKHNAKAIALLHNNADLLLEAAQALEYAEELIRNRVSQVSGGTYEHICRVLEKFN